MNEKHFKLFTPVEEGLPEDKSFVLAIMKKGENEKPFLISAKYFSSQQEWQAFYLEGFDFLVDGHKITHWLDLSKLTTKVAALELAEDAYIACNKIETFNDFISDNAKRL